MKKFFIYAAIAALVIPFVSCNNKIDYGDGPQAKIEKAKYSDYAKKVTIKSGEAKDNGIQEIEFTDGGRYIITAIKAKANEDVQIKTGTYTFKDGVYTLDDGSTISFDSNGNFTLKFKKDGKDVTVTGTFEQQPKISSTDFSRDIAHTWKISKIDISVVAQGKNVGVVKDGSNIEQIGKDLIEQAKTMGANVNIDTDKLKGYNVKTITFTSSHTLFIEFTGAPTFKASVDGISGYNFKYKLEVGVENDILNAEAECKFEPQSANTAWLTAKVKGEGFDGRVIFYLTVAD